MKTACITAILATLSAIYATPISVSSDASEKIAQGTAANVGSFLVGGPLWVNNVISNDQPIYETSVPYFVPIATATSTDVWGAKASDINLKISYFKNMQSGPQTTTRVFLKSDLNMLPDTKHAAIQLDNQGAPNYVGTNIQYFTREYTCQTGDRVIPTSRGYIDIETYGPGAVKIESDRFKVSDNRLTSMAGSEFIIHCRYVADDLRPEHINIRAESLAHSGNSVLSIAAQYFAALRYEMYPPSQPYYGAPPTYPAGTMRTSY